MDKILKLLIDDFLTQAPSSEYQLLLKTVSDAAQAFMELLDEKQKAE